MLAMNSIEHQQNSKSKDNINIILYTKIIFYIKKIIIINDFYLQNKI